MAFYRASERAFLGISALLFAASAVTTILWCSSMSAMNGMPMTGGWTMSMTWMRMPGQTWLNSAATFLGMWVVMMIAMMLPSLVPMLWQYRRAIDDIAETQIDWLTALAGVGYFLVWIVFGIVVFPLGVAVAELEMRRPEMSRAVPLAVGMVVLAAGLLQFTSWKLQQLACCREIPARQAGLKADGRTAWRHGLRLGLRCCLCCAGLTAILLAVGVMDIRAMAIVAGAITAERLSPSAESTARLIGVAIIVVGMFLIARAAWPA
jgi:predicted metal-binding membrane protein